MPKSKRFAMLNLKARIVRLGLQQKEVAQEIGISQVWLCNILNCRTSHIRRDQLRRIEEAIKTLAERKNVTASRPK